MSTKLDTKIPQFARSSDVEVFLRPPACTLDGCILGDSPFFTSVPSGRVGCGHESVYRSNDEFKQVHFVTIRVYSGFLLLLVVFNLVDMCVYVHFFIFIISYFFEKQ